MNRCHIFLDCGKHFVMCQRILVTNYVLAINIFQKRRHEVDLNTKLG